MGSALKHKKKAVGAPSEKQKESKGERKGTIGELSESHGNTIETHIGEPWKAKRKQKEGSRKTSGETLGKAKEGRGQTLEKCSKTIAEP